MLVRHIPRPWETRGGDGRVRPLTERRVAADEDAFGIEAAACAPRRVLWTVALVALATNALSLAASQLWIYPDSIDYLELAGRLVNGFDLRDELYLIRTPAYPFLLAGVFKVFGSWSPEALLVLQHGMAIGVAVFVSASAWHLTRSRAAAIVSGLLSAGSFQLLAYANLMLTEMPFTLVLTAYVYFLVRFVEFGRWRLLAIASALCGVGYLFRPVGLCLLGPCVLAGAWRVLAKKTPPNPPLVRGGGCAAAPTSSRKGIAALCGGVAYAVSVGIVPALAVTAPWMIVSRSLHHGAQASRCLDYVLYLRAASFDGLDSTRSVALNDIKVALEEAKERGVVPPNATYRDRPAVEHALRAVRGASFAEMSVLLGQAGRDLMREHPWPTFVNTFRYASWMVLDADPVYRFVPGGQPGRGGGRAKEAELFDIGTYSVGEGSWEKTLNRFAAYVPLETKPRSATPIWAAMVRAFRRAVDQPTGATSILGSRFAELMLLCGLGGAAMLLSSRRAAWGIVLSVILVHVLTSAFLGGPQTRYAVSVKPLILMCGGAGFVVLSSFALRVIRSLANSAVGIPRANVV